MESNILYENMVWYKGQTLSKIADVLEISVSELLDANIKEESPKNDIAEQLVNIVGTILSIVVYKTDYSTERPTVSEETIEESQIKWYTVSIL